MKNRPILTIVILLVVAVVFLGFRYLPSFLPESRCGEVYQRYAHVDGVRASFVKDYPINDTLFVDVTLLTATDSAGWQYLLQAFHFPVEFIEECPGIALHQSLPGHPEERFFSQNQADPNAQSLEQVVTDLAGLVLKIQATGDYEAAKSFMDSHSKVSDAFAADLHNIRLEGIPVDLRFTFTK